MLRKKRSHKELIEVSGHLDYEIEMFLDMADILYSKACSKGPIRNAVLESFVMHLRSLLDFLYLDKPNKDDDVLAGDFFADIAEWKAVRPTITANLKKAQERANKECMHLTYYRLGVQAPDKGWKYLTLAREVHEVLLKFKQAAPVAIRRDWKLPNI